MKNAPNIFPDENEPVVRQGAVFLPMWMIGLLAVLIYWGFNYVDAHGGNYDELVYEPYHSTNELASVIPADELGAQIKMGGLIYAQFCVNCHQANGAGSPNQYPPLAGSEWVQGTPNRLIRIPETGLTGPITVKGQQWNNVSMPMVAGGGLMKDEQLAAVLTYVRNSFGNKAPPVTAEQVQKVRKEIPGRTDPHTAEELLKIPATP